MLCYFGRETKGTGGPEASQVQSVLLDQWGQRYVNTFYMINVNVRQFYFKVIILICKCLTLLLCLCLFVLCFLFQGEPGIVGQPGKPGPSGRGMPGAKVSGCCTTISGCQWHHSCFNLLLRLFVRENLDRRVHQERWENQGWV